MPVNSCSFIPSTIRNLSYSYKLIHLDLNNLRHNQFVLKQLVKVLLIFRASAICFVPLSPILFSFISNSVKGLLIFRASAIILAPSEQILFYSTPMITLSFYYLSKHLLSALLHHQQLYRSNSKQFLELWTLCYLSNGFIHSVDGN